MIAKLDKISDLNATQCSYRIREHGKYLGSNMIHTFGY